jgi:uncharacterized protein involved in exopolysaccharide biosynthesis
MSGLYSQGPIHGERDTTMRDLVAVVFKRKWMILLFFVVSSALVGFKVARTPVTYSADATLMLQRKGRESNLQTNSGALPWVEVMESEVEVARSVPVLQLAKAKLLEPSENFPNGIDVSLGELNGMVETGMVGESNVIYVTSTADAYLKAIRVANKTAEAYEEYHRQMFALPDASGFTQTRADSTFRALQRLQEERGQLLIDVGFNNLEVEEQNLQRLRLDLRSSISDKEVLVAKLRTELAAVPKDLSDLEDAVPFTMSMNSTQGQGFTSSLNEYRAGKARLEDLRSRYTENHPQVREARAELQKQLEVLRGALMEVVRMREQDLRVAEAELASLRNQLAVLDENLARLPDLERQMKTLDSRIEASSKQYETLSEMAVEMEVRRESYQDYGVKMLSPAMSALRNQKGDMVRMALAPLLSLLAGIGLAFYLENLDHSMKTREDVEQHLEIPVLASFPDVDSDDSQLGPTTRRTPFWKGRKEG